MNVELAAGIDVSHWKKQIDWKKVKASGVSFAYIKATEGDDFVDSRFDYNWTRARRVGIIRGAYHFFRPLVDPAAQANNYLKIVGDILDKTDLPPALDVEAYPKYVENEFKKISVNERLERIHAWLQAVERGTGKRPIIYTEYYTWHDFLGNSTRLADYALWIANYRVETPKVPAEDWDGNGWAFWQTTERGIVPGIRDEAPCVDLDIYHGSLADLKSWVGIEGERALPPDVTNGDMMAAIVDAADRLDGKAGEWVARAGLSYLVDPVGNSLRPYDGPAVKDLPFTDEEKTILAKVLKEYTGSNSASWSITHQDLIDAFFYAASLEDKSGWALVERAGIGYVGTDRNAMYSGPVIAELPGLTPTQKEAILAYLGIPEIPEDESEVYQVPAPETPVEDSSTTAEAEEDAAQADVIPTYGEPLTNQAMINAFYLAAVSMDLDGSEMMAAAGLDGISTYRLRAYSGLRIEDLPGLSEAQKLKIADLLGVPYRPEQAEEVGEAEAVAAVDAPVDAPVETEAEQGGGYVEEGQPADVPLVDPVEVVAENPKVDVETEDVEAAEEVEETEDVETSPTYFGLLNQDIVDLFYQAAAFFDESGLDWLVEVGLAYLSKDRQTRFKMYQGPTIEQIKGLTEEQQEQLAQVLGQYRQE